MKGKNTIKRLFKGMYVSRYHVVDHHVKIYTLRYINEYRNRKIDGFVAHYAFDIDNLTSDDKQIMILMEVLEEMRLEAGKEED